MTFVLHHFLLFCGPLQIQVPTEVPMTVSNSNTRSTGPYTPEFTTLMLWHAAYTDDEWMVDSSYMCAADFVHSAQVLTSGSTLRVEFSSFDTDTEFKCYLDGKLVEDQCM